MKSDQSTEAQRLRVRLLWAQACAWDGIHPRSLFVVLSKDNPYQAEYDQAYRAWKNIELHNSPKEA